MHHIIKQQVQDIFSKYAKIAGNMLKMPLTCSNMHKLCIKQAITQTSTCKICRIYAQNTDICTHSFQADKTLTFAATRHYWSLVSLQGSNLDSHSSSCLYLIWQSLMRAIQKTIKGFDCKVNGSHWPTSQSSTLTQLWLLQFRQASTLTNRDTGSFQVGGSRCWPQQACLRKKCYHS